MFDLIYKRGCKRALGARVFLYSIAFPDLNKYPKIASFYEEICALAAQWCDTHLGAQAESEYLSLSERDRQTVFRPSLYSLLCQVSYFDGEIIILKLTATLRGAARSKRVYEVHAWALDEQCLIPPRQVARRFIPKGRLPSMRGDCGFLAEDGRYYLCKDGVLFPIEGTKNEQKNK